jgi:PA-IL-like protein
MLRRIILMGVLATSAGAYALAAERATFILTDGERKSGQVVFHGGDRENLINGHLNLGNDQGGPEFTIPISQVAVIDFVGGRPSPAELAQLPASGHMLALRNGQQQQGTFVNIIGGDTLIWRNDAGQTQQYAVTDVNRVYLNPQSARIAFNAPATGSAATSAVGTSGTLAPGTVLVQANQPWNDAGITVKKGDRVSFNTSGQISFAQGQTTGPDGDGSLRRATYPVPVMPVGGLIGRVGTSAPFPIGSNSQPIVMPADGRLMLGVNDDEYGDNTGAFTVTVTKVGR